jgi:hypothetical protein
LLDLEKWESVPPEAVRESFKRAYVEVTGATVYQILYVMCGTLRQSVRTHQQHECALCRDPDVWGQPTRYE